MKEGIKAIIFDIGGVLQLNSQQRKFQEQKHYSGVHQTIARKLKISLDQYFDSIDSAYAKSLEGKITKKKLLEIFSKNLEISQKKIERLYYKAYEKKFKLNKKLIQKANELKRLGYKIGILSDQWHLSKKALLPRKFFKNFNSIVLSCDIGIRKPNPKMYKLISKRLKIKPSNILFIDNQKWNIKPARILGMKTIIFKSNKQLFKEKIWGDLFK